MSPSIKGQPLLPFAQPSEQSMPALALSADKLQSPFADVLDDELSSGTPEDLEIAPLLQPGDDTAEPWTWFAFTHLLQLPSVTDEPAGTTSAPPSSAGTSDPASPPIEASAPSEPQEQKLPPVAGPIQKVAEQIAQNTPEAVLKGHGMVAAQPANVLLWNHQQDQLASAKEQGDGLLLEGSTDTAPAHPQPIAMTAAAPARLSQPAGEKEQVLQVDFSLSDAAPSLEVEHASEPDSIESVKATSVIQKIELQVQILRTANIDRMEVVLRPDADTQLLIQVAKIDGQIQVQVRCERGDIAFLDSHWNNVQSSLAAQGIRVEPLQHSSSATDFSNSHSSDRQQQKDPRDLGAEIDRLGMFLEIDPSPPASSARTLPQSWQRWA